MADVKKDISRRDVLKMMGLVGAAAALSSFVGEKETAKAYDLKSVPGEYIPPEPDRSEITPSSASEISALPELKSENRMWVKENPLNHPPGSYRSALTYSGERESYILHGGWMGEQNHNQTWEYKNGNWKMLEESSTLGLHGHKMVDTPEGIIMYGGIKTSPDSSRVTSNEIYLLENDSQVWKKIEPDVDTSTRGKVPERQGFGMVYNPETQSIWIMGGGYSSPVLLSYSTYELSLPGVVSENWSFKGFGDGGSNYYAVFEPLAFALEGDKAVYLYGGVGQDRGGGVGVHSTDLWKVSKVEAIAIAEKAGWPVIDYGGSVRGGFDTKKGQLVLHSGRPTFFFGSEYRETVEFDRAKNEWSKLSSIGPRVMSSPAVAMDPKTGKMLRFGGGYYNEEKNTIWSDETWMCNPMDETYLPLEVNSNE